MTNKELISKIREEILHLKMKELQRTNGINTGADVYLSSYAVLSILSNALTEESEDERIRKWLVDYFDSIKETVWIHKDITCGQILAWLEKQKDASKAIEAVDRIDKYIDEHLANAHDMKDSNPDKKYYRGWDDALGKMAGILQDVYSNEKQKENPRNADSIPADCASLAKCEDRDSKYGVFPEDVIVVARACEKLEAHGYPELAHALKNVNLYTKEQKPAEWSEEDEKMLDSVIHIITHVDDLAHEPTFAGPKWTHPYTKEIAWLKSLRPSWKPSEEQMNALNFTINYILSTNANPTVLRDLYDDLLKLK